MKVATFNVNSINARLENFLAWLKSASPDVVLLQEIKSEFNSFPFFDLQAVGYDAHIVGQKSYNGVAIISKHKMKLIRESLPDFEDENARYIEAMINFNGKDIRVASIYLPNGNPPYSNPDDTSKFTYKLRWMEAFYKHASQLITDNIPTILGGDYNVIMTDKDIYDPDAFRNNALFKEEVKQRMKAVEYLGFYDAYRIKHPHDIGYTFWDYSGNAFAADLGMRIDYLLISPQVVDMLDKCEVDKSPRGNPKPSDHTPLVIEVSVD
ncbi:MAG: exodeoxyribonuclease III [Lactobacillus sp.]|jgi:exodeoxyribonuclease-3|nr:exodeoxyribonuclease III [Lactobacillus sp.]